MAWLSAIIKAILEWLTAEVKKDTKASDADDIPKDIKDRWRERIKKQEEKTETPAKEEVKASPAPPVNRPLPSTLRKIKEREAKKAKEAGAKEE